MGKGASAQQNQIASSQQNFMGTLQNDFGTAFAGQQNILNGLNTSLKNTLAAGPSQFGFSTPQLTALNTLATNSNAQAYQNARAAAGAAAQDAGGGNTVLPTGASAANAATLAEQSGQNTSNALLGIQEAGYKQGTENYNESVSGLNRVAETENPTAFASDANNAGGEAFGSATTIQKTNQAASPWPQLGGLVGSLGGSLLNKYLPGSSTTSSSPASSAGGNYSGTPSAAFAGVRPDSSGPPGPPIDSSGLDVGLSGLNNPFSNGGGPNVVSDQPYPYV